MNKTIIFSDLKVGVKFFQSQLSDVSVTEVTVLSVSPNGYEYSYLNGWNELKSCYCGKYQGQYSAFDSISFYKTRKQAIQGLKHYFNEAIGNLK